MTSEQHKENAKTYMNELEEIIIRYRKKFLKEADELMEMLKK